MGSNGKRVSFWVDENVLNLDCNDDYTALNIIFFFFFLTFLAAPKAYGSSQTRGQIRATAASLHQSYNNTGSELHLQPTSQLTAMPDP